MEERRSLKLPSSGNGWAGLVLTALGLYGLWTFRMIIGYVLAAVALSFVGRPMVRRLERVKLWGRKLPSGLNAAITLGAMLGFGMLFLRQFAPLIATQAAAIQSIDSATAMETFGAWLARWDELTHWVDLSGTGIPNSLYLAEQAQHLVGLDGVGTIFGGIIDVIGNVLVAAFSIIFMTFFLLKDGHLVGRMISALTPDKYAENVDKIMERTVALLTRYFTGLILQVTLITAVVTAGLWIAGIPHAFLIGLLAGVLNLIPYVGPIIGMAIGVVLISSTHAGSIAELPGVIGGGLLAFLAAQVVDNLFTQPVIFANSVKAHPLEIFLVISIAGQVAGPAGMVLAIPAYTLFRIVAQETLSGFKIIDGLTKNL
jgi:predicted PurR-regulated permease PerM